MRLCMCVVSAGRGGESGGVILGYCVAQYDYAANQSQMLSLHAGDRIAILNKGAGGWWKGDLSGKVKTCSITLSLVLVSPSL
jgi:hypothetical protein